MTKLVAAVRNFAMLPKNVLAALYAVYIVQSDPEDTVRLYDKRYDHLLITINITAMNHLHSIV
jgi:hypothetical protein